jgi:hypothetical protein
MTCPPDLCSLPEARRAEHVAECAVCRLEMELGAAPDEPCDPARVNGLVVRALTDFARESKRRRMVTTMRLRWTLLAAAVLLLGAAAAASALRARRHGSSPPADVVAHAPSAALAIATTTTAASADTSSPVVAVDALPRAAAASSVAANPPPSAPSDDWTSSSLFAAANASRRQGDSAVAASQYRLLEQRFPASEEAATAHLSLALLLLDALADANGALVEVDRYLAERPQGSLREECLATRARALAKLGRREEEKRAWAELLREYPNTLYSDQARARIAE